MDLRRENVARNHWGEVQRLRQAGGATDDHFGGAVAISESAIVVGAPGDDEAATNQRSVLIFVGPDTGAPPPPEPAGFQLFLPRVIR